VELAEIGMRILFVVGGVLGGMRIADDVRAVQAHLRAQRRAG